MTQMSEVCTINPTYDVEPSTRFIEGSDKPVSVTQGSLNVSDEDHDL